MQAQFSIGVFGIIFNERARVLLCHRRDKDLWNLPGGRLEAGEAPWVGVVREVKEETGLDVRVSKLLGVYSKADKDEIVFSFLCEVTGGKILLNDEADRIEYFTNDSLPPNTSPKQVERIQDALKKLDTTVFKTQAGRSSDELLKELGLS